MRGPFPQSILGNFSTLALPHSFLCLLLWPSASGGHPHVCPALPLPSLLTCCPARPSLPGSPSSPAVPSGPCLPTTPRGPGSPCSPWGHRRSSVSEGFQEAQGLGESNSCATHLDPPPAWCPGLAWLSLWALEKQKQGQHQKLPGGGVGPKQRWPLGRVRSH